MRNRLIATTLALSALAVAAAPLSAEARTKHRVLICGNIKGNANTGTVIGAIGGGLLGNAVSKGGGKTGGTIIGAGVGAVAGHEIAKNNAKKRKCHYEYRYR